MRSVACAGVMVAMLPGCGGSSDDKTGTPDAAVADAAVDGASGPRVTWRGIIYDIDRTKPLTTDDQAPLAGVEVCAVVPGEPKMCVTSGADGGWMLSFPAGTKGIAFSAAKAASASVLYVSATLDTDELEVVAFLPRATDVAAFMTSCGANAPASDAALLIQGYRRVEPAYVPLEGGTMTASGGVGPCYMQSLWVHGAMQTATTADGYGFSVFGNVPVAGGSATARVALTGAACTPDREAVSVTADQTMKLPVQPGFLTWVVVNCE